MSHIHSLTQRSYKLKVERWSRSGHENEWCISSDLLSHKASRFLSTQYPKPKNKVREVENLENGLVTPSQHINHNGVQLKLLDKTSFHLILVTCLSFFHIQFSFSSFKCWGQPLVKDTGQEKMGSLSSNTPDL